MCPQEEMREYDHLQKPVLNMSIVTCLFCMSVYSRFLRPSAKEKLRKTKPNVFVGSQKKASERRQDLRGVKGNKDSDKSNVKGVLGTKNEVGPEAYFGTHN